MLAVFGGIVGIGGMAAMIWMSVHTNQKKHAEKNGARMQHTYQQMQTSKGQVRQVDGRTESRYSPGRRKREEEREWNMEEYMMASEGVGETTLLNAAGGETTDVYKRQETIFYTMSVYFMTANIKKTRYTLAGALLATFAGIAVSVLLASGMYAG